MEYFLSLFLEIPIVFVGDINYILKGFFLPFIYKFLFPLGLLFFLFVLASFLHIGLFPQLSDNIWLSRVRMIISLCAKVELALRGFLVK